MRLGEKLLRLRGVLGAKKILWSILNLNITAKNITKK